MATITLTGTPADTNSDVPVVGSKAPDFTLVKTNLSEVHLRDYAGRTLVLNIILSVDTDTCPRSMRRFDAELEKLQNIAVLTVSNDLPFAQGRYLRGASLNRIEAASCFRDPAFAKAYGVLMINGPLKGMLARAVVVIDGEGIVRYSRLVSEINDEPDYDAVLAALP